MVKVFVRFPRDEGNRITSFPDIPKICSTVAILGADRMYKVTEITYDDPVPGTVCTLLLRR